MEYRRPRDDIMASDGLMGEAYASGTSFSENIRVPHPQVENRLCRPVTGKVKEAADPRVERGGLA